MGYLISSVLLFTISVCIHLAWSRGKEKGALQVKPFFVATTLCFFIHGLVLYFYFPAIVQQPYTFWTLPLMKTSAVLYVLLIPCYFIFYASTVIDSASRLTISLLKEKGELSFDELKKYVTDERFIISRLEALVAQGYINIEGGAYRLRPHSLFIARLLKFYQIIIGRETGG